VIREQALDAFKADAQEAKDVFKADAQEAKDVFNWVDVQFNGRLATTFKFRGLTCQLKDLLKFPPFIISHIIWELCENNFTDDVLWLDALFRWGLDSTDTYGPERSVEVYSLCGKKLSNTPMPLVNILTFIFENMISHSNCMISLGSKFLWVRKMETAGDAC
jgi:hypothetical protein